MTRSSVPNDGISRVKIEVVNALQGKHFHWRSPRFVLTGLVVWAQAICLSQQFCQRPYFLWWEGGAWKRDILVLDHPRDVPSQCHFASSPFRPYFVIYNLASSFIFGISMHDPHRLPRIIPKISPHVKSYVLTDPVARI